MGRRAEAETHYAEAIRLKPNLGEAHYCLGVDIGQDGDAAGAAAQFAETVHLKPELIEARLNLGIAFSNQGIKQQALEQLDEVLRRDPHNRIAIAELEKLNANVAQPPGSPK